jgi:hypothetical protein
LEASRSDPVSNIGSKVPDVILLTKVQAAVGIGLNGRVFVSVGPSFDEGSVE